jgi:hypothetical protein
MQIEDSRHLRRSRARNRPKSRTSSTLDRAKIPSNYLMLDAGTAGNDARAGVKLSLARDGCRD